MNRKEGEAAQARRTVLKPLFDAPKSDRNRWLSGSQRGAYRRETEQNRRTWRAIWAQTAEGVGLTNEVHVAAGVTTIVPPLLGVISRVGEITLVVDMLRGQVIDDYAAVAPRLAVALDAARVAVVPRAGRTIGLVLHDTDPVAQPFTVLLPVVPSIHDPVVVGRAEDGAVIRHVFAEPAHVICQGGNGSGKSRLSYGLLGQVAHANDVVIAGSDITGLLLGPPWDGTRHREWQAAGTADLEAHAVALERIVALMDERLQNMPRGVDKIDPTPERPLFLVPIEEFPGLLRATEAMGTGKESVNARVKLANLRLLSEGRKAAIRVFTLAQRAEAQTIGGGYAREQYALTISVRVPGDSLVMLHGDDARELGQRHRTADPGIAVISAPGRPLSRMRAPTVGTYAEYCQAVGPQS